MDKEIKCTLLDRISHLPDNAIDIILSCLPLRDAARTSILSKKWRPCWSTVDNLVLNYDFTRALYRGREKLLLSEYVEVVDKILSSHRGSIRKFVLHIPGFEDEPTSDVVNRWILAAAEHDVQDLKLDYGQPDNCVPSYLFQCTKLKHLSLNNVSHAPFPFGKLPSLLSLEYCHECDEFDEDLITNFILNSPMLESVSAECIDLPPLLVSGSKLKHLYASYHDHLNLYLENTPNLSTIQLYSEECEDMTVECQAIVDFFHAVPKIESITLPHQVLEEWSVQGVPQKLPVPLENHFNLTVRWLKRNAAGPLRVLFCLIKSSPRLQTLTITMYHSFLPASLREPETHDGQEYLQSQVKELENSWSLKSVIISNLMGKKLEIDFIKVILARCPNLEKLYLVGSPGISSNSKSAMKTKIMKLNRASTQAEIIYPRY